MRLPIIIFVTLLLLPYALAQLSCNITTTATCAGVPVLKLSAATDAHASTPVPAAVASHVICCTGVADLAVSYAPLPNKFVIGLATPSDSHASITRGDYANEVYITSNTYNVTCGEELLPAECGAYQTCLYEVPGGGADDHVFGCSSPGLASRRQVCCSATLLAGPTCNDSDGGTDYYTQGTATDGTGSSTDSCLAATNTLTEYRCNASNARESVHYACPDGCAIDASGACQPAPEAPGFECTVTNIFWTDWYEHGLAQAVVNYPLSAIIVGSGCSGTTADFTIYDNLGNVVEADPEGDNGNYINDGNIWYAIVNWTPTNPGQYYFNVNSIAGANSSLSQNSPILNVVGSCDITPSEGELCPEDWPGGPNDLTDSDCDGVRDCFDQWLGNYGGQIDSTTGVPIGLVGCQGVAWDCSETTFSECVSDPESPGNYIQTREGDCTRIASYTQYCPPPLDTRGCVIEEDFPVFGLMNILAVSILLIGFYARRFIK